MVFVETSFPRGGTVKPVKAESVEDESKEIVSTRNGYHINGFANKEI